MEIANSHPHDLPKGLLAILRLKEAFKELKHENALLTSRQNRTRQQLDTLRKVSFCKRQSLQILSR
jgi:hypothetical protein